MQLQEISKGGGGGGGEVNHQRGLAVAWWVGLE